MKFCTKCGAEIEENKKFCTKCGTKISDGQIISTPKTQEVGVQLTNAQTMDLKPENQYSTTKKEIKLSKTQKRTGIIAAIILILVFTCYKIGENAASKEKVISQFSEAMTTKNSDNMAKYVVSSDSKLKINSESLGVFLDYLDKNPSYTNEIIKSIEKQASKFDENLKVNNTKSNLLNELSGENIESSLFTLKKQGKKWGLYDNYVLELKPVYMTLTTNLKDVQIFKGEELIATSDSENFTKEVGPYIPAVYKLKAVYKGKYVNLEKEKEVDLIKSGNTNQNKLNVQLNLEPRYIKVSTEAGYEDAKLFINGTDANILIKDAAKLGPIDANTRIYAVKNVDGKEVKTKEVVVGTTNYIYLEFPKEVKQNENLPNSSYKPPVFNTITASSKLVEKNITHEPQNVADNNKATAWVEGNSSDGIGEWIKLESNTEQSIIGFSIINGYAKDNNLYYANNRVAKLLVEYSDGTSFTFNLTDGNFNEQGITFDNIKKTKYIKFTITGVYKGSKYSDTCISEIKVF